MNLKEDQLAIQSLRVLAIEAINKAKSGHPGIALGAAPIIHTLFMKCMTINPNEPDWINRDRFVMAAGHGSALLYSILHLCGYNISVDDLQQFRQLNSITPGHPERQLTPGVDVSSGPLGQGIAEGVGLALAEEHLHAKFPKLINHYTFVLCGDGDLQEGVTQEAISLAGNLDLSKLIVLYDSNDVQLDGFVNLTNTEKTKGKFEAMNWDYQLVKDGESVEEIYKAIERAKTTDKPSIIEIKTVIGFGAKEQGTSSVHGAPLKAEEVEQMRKMLGGEPFTINPLVYDYYHKQVIDKGVNAYENWKKEEVQYHDPLFTAMINDDIKIDFTTQLASFPENYVAATRVSSGTILKELSKLHPGLIGGSADLTSSTNVAGADGEFSTNNRLGRNIKFGVREHAMAAISNGIALHRGLRPFCSGFFVFSDYMKPAIRLSALMELPVIYIFTHDSIAVGEDGPTHEPIEQLTMLRSIPNVNVIRPADANEVKEAYKIALESKHTPTVLVLTRQNVPTVTKEPPVDLGGYVVEDCTNPDGVLIASGSELSLALEASKILRQQKINVRVISLPSMFLFDKQSAKYKDDILLPYLSKRMAIEMGEGSHFYKYVGAFGKVYNINQFGLSGKNTDVMKAFGFTAEEVAKAYLELERVDFIRYIK